MYAHNGSFYRAVYTGYPEGSRLTAKVRDLDEYEQSYAGRYHDEVDESQMDEVVDLGPDPSWEPEGWLADPERRADWIEYHGDAKFFWPTDQKMWCTFRTANERVKLFERYGATGKVIQSDPLHWPTQEELRDREIAKLEGQIERLRGQSDGRD